MNFVNGAVPFTRKMPRLKLVLTVELFKDARDHTLLYVSVQDVGEYLLESGPETKIKTKRIP